MLFVVLDLCFVFVPVAVFFFFVVLVFDFFSVLVFVFLPEVVCVFFTVEVLVFVGDVFLIGELAGTVDLIPVGFPAVFPACLW